MKIGEYLKDRAAACLIGVAAWLLAVIFLFAFHVQFRAVVTVSVILLIGALAAELWNYMRKRNYYGKLMQDMERLDKKYLLSEMSEEPSFLDGRLLYEVMHETNKSMCEQIAVHRRDAAEFREYIELWVHEIKLPVASLQLMCHNDGNTRYSEQLRRIDEYIENVLYYARSGNAEKDYIIKPVSLKRIFADIAVRNREELQERGIALTTCGLDTEVMSDGKWLSFMLGQLMGNSLKYGADEIRVTAEELQDRTVLHFRDNGEGIPESDLPYIFEKSFTGENGRTHTKSTGMGLYIVRKLCGKLGHGISADSVRGEFTEISISFGRNELYRVE